MRPVVVKSPGFSQCWAHLHLSPQQTSRAGRRGRKFSDASTIKTRRWFNRDPRELAASSRRSTGAPTLLLSVSVRCTEHQRLIREAWSRAPLLELGVTSVNPSRRRALAPARGSPTRDRSVVPSPLDRFQLGAIWNRSGFQIAPEGD